MTRVPPPSIYYAYVKQITTLCGRVRTQIACVRCITWILNAAPNGRVCKKKKDLFTFVVRQPFEKRNTQTRPRLESYGKTDGFLSNRLKIIVQKSLTSRLPLRRLIFTSVSRYFCNTKRPKTGFVSYLIARNHPSGQPGESRRRVKRCRFRFTATNSRWLNVHNRFICGCEKKKTLNASVGVISGNGC